MKGFPLELGIGAWSPKKLEWWDTGPREKLNDIFSRLDTIHQRDRQPDTGRQQRPGARERQISWEQTNRRRDRDVEGVEAEGYGVGYPLPIRLGGLGSVVSSPNGVRGGAPAQNEFGAFWCPQEALVGTSYIRIMVAKIHKVLWRMF